jgi:hypothetical protein
MRTVFNGWHCNEDKMTDKEKRETFGVAMAPTPATRVFKKQMEHFRNIDGWAWILVNDKTKVVVHVNTYRGKAGRKWKARELPLNDNTTKTYQEVSISDCPVATPAI